jgi:hypothetical protein
MKLQENPSGGVMLLNAKKLTGLTDRCDGANCRFSQMLCESTYPKFILAQE